MITKCLSCGKIFDVEVAWKGQEVTCDSCGKDFLVKKYIECPKCSQLTPENGDKCESCNSPITIPLKRSPLLKSALTMPASKQKSQSVNSDSDEKANAVSTVYNPKRHSQTIDYGADKIAIESDKRRITKFKSVVILISVLVVIVISVFIPKQIYDKLWAELGSASAQYNLGRRYYNGDGVKEDKAEAGKWYKEAADQNFPEAQYALGKYYYDGYGTPRERACCGNADLVEWYRRAAYQGLAVAQRDLGECYYNGYGSTENKNKAVEWFRKAAEQGDTIAQYNLGVCYYNGNGVAKDQVEAVKWFRKAAEHGDAKAQFNLGCCYQDGEGVAKDEVEAAKLYHKAAEQGNAKAKDEQEKRVLKGVRQWVNTANREMFFIGKNASKEEVTAKMNAYCDAIGLKNTPEQIKVLVQVVIDNSKLK